MLTGSPLRFDIWKKDSDHTDWKKYHEYFKREPAFDSEKSKRLTDIYSFIQKELGSDYLKNRYRDGRNLINNWLFSKGNKYSELNWLYEGLSHFKSKGTDCNYKKLLQPLRTDNNCNKEGIPFLIAGDSLRKAGLDVIFEPDVEFKKKPDLKITHPGTEEVIYGEVSQLFNSDPREESRSTYLSLIHFFLLYPPHVPFAGKINRAIAKNKISAIGRYIIQLKERALNEDALLIADYEETDNSIEFAVAHPDRINELEIWEKEKKFNGIGNILGLSLDFDYTSRMLSKLEDKAKQLPPQFPGIIYISLASEYFIFGISDPHSIIDSVYKTLKPFPQVMGVCLYTHLGEETNYFQCCFESNFFERKMVHGDTQQVTLFIANPVFNIYVSYDLSEKIYSSFRNMFQ